MTITEINDYVRSLDGVLVLRPQEGDGSPEVAWGDVFFHYAPDGVVPRVAALRNDRDHGLPG